MPASIPTAETVTPEWMTETLKASGTMVSGSVTDLQLERIGDGQGFVSECCRIHLVCDDGSGVPGSLIGKFAHPDEAHRSWLFPLCEREVRFYNEVAPKIELRVPRCYHASCDAETALSLVLLEDLRDGWIGDNGNGCTAEDAELVVRALPALHAPWWRSKQVAQADWLMRHPPLRDSTAIRRWRENQDRNWAMFEKRYADSERFLEARTALRSCGPRIRQLALECPETLVHGDYRLDNMFIGNDGGGPVLFDWQTAGCYPGAYDLVYFLIHCLSVDLRRERQKDFIETYCTLLRERGIQAYDAEQCGRHCHISLYNMVFPRLIAWAALFDFGNTRAASLMDVLLDRMEAAIQDYPVEALAE